ncbi:vWA domain-containing protein [Dactylosporangium sp. CA-152071]|uniref:vWA domain-containing protein n=1 Tax=Dactylosporangium sp. CA-152071 TaxID=3239933 RepID=UPI003D8F2041
MSSSPDRLPDDGLPGSGALPDGGGLPGEGVAAGLPEHGLSDGAPDGALRALAESTAPYLIGVRHHSPALSAVMDDLLDVARPEVLLLELPAEFADWLPWLADPATTAPVALAGVAGPSGSAAFYPFADFSPELVAVRWAARNGVEVIPCDLPLADRAWHEDLPGNDPAPEVPGLDAPASDGPPPPESAPPATAPNGTAPGGATLDGAAPDGATADGATIDGVAPSRAAAGGRPVVAAVAPEGMRFLGDALRRAATGRPDEDMWDRVVEARSPGAAPEAVRRAALLVGWAMRHDTGSDVTPLDLRREAWMRRHLVALEGRRVAAVVGSFHAWALLDVDKSVDDPGHSRTLDGSVPSRTAHIDGSDTPRAVPDATPRSASVEAPGVDAVPRARRVGKGREVVTSLVPYAFSLLDARSGYPAGIRDPRWQQAVVAAGGRPEAVEHAALSAIVEVCARVRAAGHPSGPAEAREAFRLATDLARLRALPAPGRGEIVEALQSVIAHGEVLGRGRVVATAMEQVLVGDERGVLAPGTPRSGLRPAVEALVKELRLPVAGEKARDMRLDSLRSDLDRRREVTLRQLEVCRVPYGERVAVEGAGGADALTTRWTVQWVPGTEAMLELAGMRGVTLTQAAEGTLRHRRRTEQDDNGPTSAQLIDGLAVAAGCGLVALARERVAEVAAEVPAAASLDELMAALALVDRLDRGHVPGLPAGVLDGLGQVIESLESAAVRQVDGLTGSESVDDVRALVALAQRADAAGVGLRLAGAVERLVADGSPVMSAAAGAVQVMLGLEEPPALGVRLASWVDAARADEGRRKLLGHLRGLLTAAEPLLQAGEEILGGLLDRVETLPDDDFLSRLPALRGGFQAVSPAGRDRLLAVVERRLGDAGSARDIGDASAEDLLVRLLADRAGAAALAAYGLTVPTAAPASEPAKSGSTEPAQDTEPPKSDTGRPEETGSLETGQLETAGGAETGQGTEPTDPGSVETGQAAEHSGRTLSTVDRWRLLLGRRSEALGPGAARYATALDELYGAGTGEGARADAAGRAGREAPFPGVREWAEELTALFGPGIREEVLARAAESGRREAALLLDPDAVTPSVELLQTVLSLVGAMPESSVARLRPLVARIVEELTRQLATRLRPALAGITTPRPTRRPGGPLDLPRTLRANLATTRRDEDGRVQVIPERPVFRTKARRGVDWRLVLVVDVSGSMEASVIWSALTGAILAGVPALTTHFVAFSTEVVDLTDRVTDPLGLLLEVKVGGGTHIAAGLRHARSLVTVPSRTLVVVVSDFEEGYPLGGLLAETRSLVESGATVLGCASLDDAGRPRYSVSVASQLVACGMPVAALSPLELARWVGEKVRA